MSQQQPEGEGRRVLATDLDGTLIPLDARPQNRTDLETLADQVAQDRVALVFVTGRHIESVLEAITEFHLPRPHWIICDVGTSIFQQRADGTYEPVVAYRDHQQEIVAALPIGALRERLAPIGGLRLQEEDRQSQFKLSYYADAAALDGLVDRIQLELDQGAAPYSVIHSVDPFNGDGLVDLLPATVSKAHALAWWVAHTGQSPDGIVFAGDAGNDLAALTAGYRSVLVGNADRQLAQRVYWAHRQAAWKNRLYLARGAATSGVLEGCRWFGLVAGAAPLEVGPLGATPVTHDQTHFSVWAPRCRQVAVEVQHPDRTVRRAMTRHENGYFAGTVSDAAPGALYQYVLDDRVARPDPASRYQPDGVHGASRIVDSQSFPWTDQTWKGVPKSDLIIYELHVGAFTEAGTFRAAIERLSDLLDLGVTAVEIMPIAQSPGRWNWGYDGVDLFAVRNTYGAPDDFKAFVDACHAKGLAVILDVVYNHVGPEGNYLAEFGPYFSSKHHAPWGEAFNFDQRHAKHVRRFIIDNAVYWLGEYHLDGLRLDAVRIMFDESTPTILSDIRQAVSSYEAKVERTLHLIAESNVYVPTLLESNGNVPAYDATWSDCLMQSIYSLALPDLRLTQRRYAGARDVAIALQNGYVYTASGETGASRQQRGRSSHDQDGRSRVASFVVGLQTHDSVGNHPLGKRLHQLTSKSFQKSAAALVLLYPSVPLIFMGEECATEAPFPFFVDFHDARLRKAVDDGRMREYPQHDWRGAMLPSDANTFYRAKCHRPNDGDAEMAAWYRALIRLRKQGIAEGWLLAACLTSWHNPDWNSFGLSFEGTDGRNTVVLARLNDVGLADVVPVRAPLEGRLLLSSEPNPEICDGHVLLQPNHAVVSRSTCARAS